MMTLFVFTTVFAETAAERKTENYYQTIKTNPIKLRAFLYSMPKGGELHFHESGSALPENLLQYARPDQLCLDKQTYTVFVAPMCTVKNRLNVTTKNPKFYNEIIDAWSMRNFVAGKETGHDHFFATFGKFGEISKTRSGEILTEITQRAALQNEQYLEVMTTADQNESGMLGKALGWDPDFATMREKLLAADFDSIMTHISSALDKDEAKRNKILSCQSKSPKAGCNITVRYLYQVLREQAPERVFAQLLAGFESAGKDARIVGVNMVQPEDGEISMRDYKLHMEMVKYLRSVYPNVRVSLHAGELTSALVPPEGLKFHIYDAVEVALAERIGHGIDIAGEDKVDQLLKDMAYRRVMVEINLSSNAAILGVAGKKHPLHLYLRHQVPVALSTDDEGITREDLTKQYEQAAVAHELPYLTLKTFARNSITYSFLPGKTLWRDYNYQQVTAECAQDVLGAKPSSTCQTFLSSNEKANMQWELEKKFSMFEKQF